MGKGTDKLYITHSEWSSEDAFSASAGSGLSKSRAADNTFKRLPFNICAVSLQPFSTPVCTPTGTIFDIDHILTWLQNHGTDPTTGLKLSAADLIRLHFAKNEAGEYVDPVTFKVITDNTHLVAIRKTGNVFAWDTIEKLNIKAKMWRDLVSDEVFTRKDIITLQDPLDVGKRDMSQFKYVKDGISTLTPGQERERGAGVNKAALGNAAAVLGPNKNESSKPVVGKYLHQKPTSSSASSKTASSKALIQPASTSPPSVNTPKAPLPISHAPKSLHTTGQAAASLTSTGLTPHTSSALTTLSDEEYMLKPRRVKSSGYIRISTTHGPLTLELLPEFAPRAVWNFVTLSKRGYYNGVIFHRNIRNFMLQGGDPTGTGRGGESCWASSSDGKAGGKKVFQDEFDGPRSHDKRGIVSMANKGKDTNSSQFFITYRPCAHLNRKHTIFGRVVDDASEVTLGRIEQVPVSEKDMRPLEEVVMESVEVLVDPFEEFMRERREKEEGERVEEEVRRAGGREEERVTWTGKRLREGDGGDVAVAVGKYLGKKDADAPKGEVLEEWEGGGTARRVVEEPVKKKVKAGQGYGNFDSW